MSELLKWLSEHDGVLIFFLSLIALLVVFFFVSAALAQKGGGSWGLWPPRVQAGTKIVGVSSKLKLEVGTADMPERHEAFYENVQPKMRPRTCSVSIEYSEPFKKKPKIFLALSKIDLGGSIAGNHIDRLRLRTEEEHTDGFRLVFETWSDSIVYNAAASWIAVGE